MEPSLFRIMETGSMTNEVIISQDDSSETKIIDKIMKVKYDIQRATNFTFWPYSSGVSIASYKFSKF